MKIQMEIWVRMRRKIRKMDGTQTELSLTGKIVSNIVFIYLLFSGA